MFISTNKKIRIEEDKQNNTFDLYESKENYPTKWSQVSKYDSFNQALKHGLELCDARLYNILLSNRR